MRRKTMEIRRFIGDQQVFEQYSKTDQEHLRSFLSSITYQYYLGKHAAIWFETEAMQGWIDDLPASEITHKGQPIPLATLLRTIFDTQAGTMGIKHIIVDEQLNSDENWIYNDLGLWIMTYRFYITALYMVFVQKQWDADPLLLYAEKHGISLDGKD